MHVFVLFVEKKNRLSGICFSFRQVGVGSLSSFRQKAVICGGSTGVLHSLNFCLKL